MGKAKNLDELRGYLQEKVLIQTGNLDNDNNHVKVSSDSSHKKEDDIKFDWDKVDEKSSIFILRIGEDRGGEEKEYSLTRWK